MNREDLKDPEDKTAAYAFFEVLEVLAVRFFGQFLE